MHSFCFYQEVLIQSKWHIRGAVPWSSCQVKCPAQEHIYAADKWSVQLSRAQPQDLWVIRPEPGPLHHLLKKKKQSLTEWCFLAVLNLQINTDFWHETLSWHSLIRPNDIIIIWLSWVVFSCISSQWAHSSIFKYLAFVYCSRLLF